MSLLYVFDIRARSHTREGALPFVRSRSRGEVTRKMTGGEHQSGRHLSGTAFAFLSLFLFFFSLYLSLSRRSQLAKLLLFFFARFPRVRPRLSRSSSLNVDDSTEPTIVLPRVYRVFISVTSARESKGT